MSSRMYESGAEKRKKKQRLEAAAQSQKGALDRFLLRETPPINDDHGHGDAAVECCSLIEHEVSCIFIVLPLLFDILQNSV